MLWLDLFVSLVTRNTSKFLVFLCWGFLSIIRFVLVILYVMHRNICLRFCLVTINTDVILSLRVHLNKILYIDLFM